MKFDLKDFLMPTKGKVFIFLLLLFVSSNIWNVMSIGCADCGGISGFPLIFSTSSNKLYLDTTTGESGFVETFNMFNFLIDVALYYAASSLLMYIKEFRK